MACDRLVEAQAGARRVGLRLDLDLGDAERDQHLQLRDALGDGIRFGEAEPGLEYRQRLLELVVAVEVAGDDEQRVAALHRVGRFAVGVVGARQHMVGIAGGDLRLGQTQPHQPVIGAVGDRLFQIVDRLRVAFRLVFGVGVLAQAGDQRSAGAFLPRSGRAGPAGIACRRRPALSTRIRRRWWARPRGRGQGREPATRREACKPPGTPRVKAREAYIR